MACPTLGNPHCSTLSVILAYQAVSHFYVPINRQWPQYFIGTPKALRTSSNPGHTRVISTRLKISEDPLIYSYDSPGVMLPFLGQGPKGAERGVKLALIGVLAPNRFIPTETTNT